jgi:hypothetical protein
MEPATDATEGARSGEFSLFNLTQAERDALLATIVYVDSPICFWWAENRPSNLLFSHKLEVVNYSTFHGSLTEAAKPKVPNVAHLRTGDMILMSDYRGIGSFYVIWLRSYLSPDTALTASFELSEQLLTLPDYPNEDILLNTATARRPSLLRPVTNFVENIASRFGLSTEQQHPLFPVVAAREADGAHNDGFHHCYLFSHPDEYGYMSPGAVSSARDNYFKRDYKSAAIDPILTHSESFYGKLIAECKQEPLLIDNPLFPLHYCGCCDRYDDTISANMIQWSPRSNQPDMTLSIFTKHFEIEINGEYVLK